MIEIENFIRDIQGFPKPGILFKDIAPLLNSPEATRECLRQLLQLVKNKHIDKVVGVESRGFFFGTLIAQKLNVGFVPVRKPGKLPFTTVSQLYDLEYGTDKVEMHIDAIQKGDRVLMHDDVLATGGTAEAVCKLIESQGGIVVQCNFIMTLDFLNGKDKLKGYDIASVLNY
ncbi:MAG: adenine phosphoribosyltransferase [Flavobacteriaceae bacterium]|jgi:adenine phosphoribosyltransferase